MARKRKKRKKKPNRLLAFYHQHRYHIFGILTMLFSVLMMLSMITYWIPTTSVWANLGGPLGRNLSHGLFQLCGFLAFLIPVYLFLWGENSYAHLPVRPLLKKTVLSLTASVYIVLFLSTFLNAPLVKLFSGYIGFSFLTMLQAKIGPFLTSFILFLPMLLAGVYFFHAYASIADVKRSLYRLAQRVYFGWRHYRLQHHQPEPATAQAQPPKALQPPFGLDPGKAIKSSVKFGQDPEDDEEVLIHNPKTAKTPRPITLEEADPTESSDSSDKPEHSGDPTPIQLPPIDLLEKPPQRNQKVDREEVMKIASLIEENLAHYNVQGKITEVHPGPIITRYEFKPAPGIKVSRITNLADDLALVLSAHRVRFQAPVPGKPVVGIEVPNKNSETVYLREILQSRAFRKIDSTIPIALGKDTAGVPLAADLSKMPHLLIAGATGSGKSVCVNTIITSILYRSTPEQVRFLMIDPKMLELSIYNGIPHLHRPVVTDRKDAVKILKWAVWEMERRYRLLAKVGVRNIKSFNLRIERNNQLQMDMFDKNLRKPLPYIVIIIDELADLMMTVANEIEDVLARLAQMARAIGIHLILATQRPSVDVITGLIKANFPSRISFQASSKVDSRTIIDQNGAEKLLGNGDMLFLPSTAPEPVRIHGSYISSEDTHAIVKFLAEQAGNDYVSYEELDDFELDSVIEKQVEEEEMDDLFDEAKRLVISQQMASVSLLQRRLRIGYARAGRLVDQLHQAGVVGPHEGSKSRKVLVKTFDPISENV